MNKTLKIHRLKYELEQIQRGYERIAGIDEVGRGPLAGPLVVATVVFKKEDLLSFNKNPETPNLLFFNDIKDSKKLTEKKRETLAEQIKVTALDYALDVVDNETLDQEGISKITQSSFYKALNALGENWDFVLTDSFPIKGLPKDRQINLVKGDNLSISIGAASIIAKVHRDNIMKVMALRYPEYGFEKHKGYGTKAHLEALKKFGPCEIHRKSFEPIKSMVNA